MPRAIPEETKELIRFDYAAGRHARDIASTRGVGLSSVYRIVNEPPAKPNACDPPLPSYIDNWIDSMERWRGHMNRYLKDFENESILIKKEIYEAIDRTNEDRKIGQEVLAGRVSNLQHQIEEVGGRLSNHQAMIVGDVKMLRQEVKALASGRQLDFDITRRVSKRAEAMARFAICLSLATAVALVVVAAHFSGEI